MHAAEHGEHPVSAAFGAFDASVRLIAAGPIGAVRIDIHLVLEDAVIGSTRCMADDEHAPAGNIDPDGISLVGGSSGDGLTRPAAGSSPLPPAHRGHLQQFAGTLRHLALPSLSKGNGSSRNFAAALRTGILSCRDWFAWAASRCFVSRGRWGSKRWQDGARVAFRRAVENSCRVRKT